MVQLLTYLLVLLINIITTEYVAERKFYRFKTYSIIFLYTLIMITLFRYILPLVFAESIPNIIVILFSWTFLPVFMYLYKNKVQTLIIIMAFSFSHTLLVNGLVYHYFIITNGKHDIFAFLWTQIAIFIISTPVIIYYIRQTLKKVLSSLDYLLFKTAVFVPLLNFILIYVSRFLIEFKDLYPLFIFYISMVLMIMASYYFIYRIISTLSSNKTLKDLVYIDQLTKLKNRMALYKDFKEISYQEGQCTLYYMDLNNFKEVNDRNGHVIGDDYLIHFSQVLQKTFEVPLGIYRISGDEFIVITRKSYKSTVDIKKNIQKHFRHKETFLGVSIGFAEFPEEGIDLDTLLNIADQRMYEDKKNKDK
ncbi:MAG: GGDEF domain-containing protein [Candidatus Izemoplasmatales bacterium]